MKNSKKSRVGLYILYGAVTVFLLALILSFGDLEQIWQTIKSSDIRYILLAFLCIALYILLYPLSLCILTRAKGCNIKMKKTYGISMTEHFFNGITPFATGGQPFQVYSFSKEKVTPTESTCLLLMNFMVFMLVTNTFAATALFYFKRFVTDTAMAIIAAVGFTINFLVLAVTFLVAKSKKVSAFLSGAVEWFCRFKFINRLVGEKKENLKEYFVNVQLAFSQLMKKKAAFVLAFVSKFLAMGIYYLTTYFILLALHVNVSASDIFFIISGTSFAITMVVFMPTPGSSGGIEFAFKSVFATIASGAAASVAYSGMLVWRLLSYYFVMLVSLFFYILLEIGYSKSQKKGGTAP